MNWGMRLCLRNSGRQKRHGFYRSRGEGSKRDYCSRDCSCCCAYYRWRPSVAAFCARRGWHWRAANTTRSALTPLEKDVYDGSGVLQYFAITAAWTGEKELALRQLETGLRVPAASLVLSYGALKLLPFWDPLRGDPRFEKIVASLAPKAPSK